MPVLLPASQTLLDLLWQSGSWQKFPRPCLFSFLYQLSPQLFTTASQKALRTTCQPTCPLFVYVFIRRFCEEGHLISALPAAAAAALVSLLMSNFRPRHFRIVYLFSRLRRKWHWQKTERKLLRTFSLVHSLDGASIRLWLNRQSEGVRL